ncbi:hypothetical protein CBR_g49341 [Chara braunii]|uniref:PARP alpha-helical domain-containing protein n=1 Tax=Chara braunii TaxID=69332 RepID=A0A388M4Z9_CHABU|nr:hypothetical protein CBR_g49341 [Chara braunii]|eukprot:GBG89552.1 hypothetical protein CBR_g49341 [Chara braunii]
MVETRGGTNTTPNTQAQEERAATIMQERREKKEKKELLKQAKLKAIAKEQATKKNKLEEEMMRLQQEEEEKKRVAEEEAAEEEEELEEEGPLERRRRRERGESSGTKGEDAWVEKKISEWVANLSLGKDEEAMLYVPQEEKEAVAREMEAMEDPLDRQKLENEKRLEWKLRLAREKKRRREEGNRMAKEVETIQLCRQEVQAQQDTQAKLDKIPSYLETLGQAWIEQHHTNKGQEVALHSIRTGFREFARDVLTHVRTEVRWLKEGADKFCAGAIEGAKVVATTKSEARSLKEPVKLKFPDAYGGKSEGNFDNWRLVSIVTTLQEHQGHLTQVLGKLRESNFKINVKKCEWAKTKVLYLGHALDRDEIKPEDSKIATIRDWLTPHSLTELRSFLGLANYYRKFVRNFSTIAAPLRRLLRKEAIWTWDKDCTSALKKLKRALIEYLFLKVADPSLPVVVTTDANQYGIGAVLQQDDDNGYRPVEFMSARMPSTKVATSTYERELYALRQALEHWKHYLLGRHFKVDSDHEILRWLKTQAKMTPKLTRWAVEIDQYDFELKPVKGKYNVVADALSRRLDYFGAIVHYLDVGSDLQKKVRQTYAEDLIYSDLLKRVKEAPETEPDYCTTEELLFEKTNVVDHLCVPNSEEIRSLILGECHDTEGHFGWQKTLANLMQAYTWPGMKNDCIEYVRSCKAIDLFKKKFLDKSGNHWDDRHNFVSKRGKYTLIEIDYAEEEEDNASKEKEKSSAKDKSIVQGKGSAKDKAAKGKENEIASKLAPRLLDFVQLICDIKMMQDQMMEIGYDTRKMPLGKLSKTTVLKGYSVLKRIAAVLDGESTESLDALSR